MTSTDQTASHDPRPSLLPFDPKDLIAMRVRPADFARMCSVSKQTVSRWIKKGTVTLGPDGLLDPSKAAREVLQRTDPARIRSRVFKLASSTHEDLRERIKTLESELAESRGPAQVQRDKALERSFLDSQARCIFELEAVLVARFGELVDAHNRGGSAELDDLLDSIVEAIFYPEAETPESDMAETLLPGQAFPAALVAAEEGEEISNDSRTEKEK